MTPSEPQMTKMTPEWAPGAYKGKDGDNDKDDDKDTDKDKADDKTTKDQDIYIRLFVLVYEMYYYCRGGVYCSVVCKIFYYLQGDIRWYMRPAAVWDSFQ